MRIRTFFYCLAQGLKNIGRNIWVALVSVASISACIFLFCTFFVMICNIRHMVRNAEEAVGVTAFFNSGISEKEIREIGEEITGRPEVKDVTYISAEEAWKSFQEDYFRDNEHLAEGFANDNPLAESASYEIHLNSIEQQDSFVNWLKEVPGVRKVNYSVDAASGLIRLNRLVSVVSSVIIAILLTVSVFLISNTISTAAAFHREEYRIMRLIGATNFMIRAPFVFEGILIGFAGALIPLGIVTFLYRHGVRIVMEKAAILSSVINFLPLREILPVMSLIALALGVGIGFVGSFFTIRKTLRV